MNLVLLKITGVLWIMALPLCFYAQGSDSLEASVSDTASVGEDEVKTYDYNKIFYRRGQAFSTVDKKPVNGIEPEGHSDFTI